MQTPATAQSVRTDKLDTTQHVCKTGVSTVKAFTISFRTLMVCSIVLSPCADQYFEARNWHVRISKDSENWSLLDTAS